MQKILAELRFYLKESITDSQGTIDTQKKLKNSKIEIKILLIQ